MQHFISCDLIYRYGHGYEAHGGRYNRLQAALEKNGWRYDIGLDAWLK